MSLLPGQNELFVEEPRTRTAAIKHIVGHPYGMITGLVQQQDSGRLVFDEFGAPVPTNKHEILGNGVPKFTGGVNNSVSYKQFHLAFLVDFKWGGQIYSGINSRMTLWGFHKQTVTGRAEEAPLMIEGVQQIMDNNGTPNDGSDDRYVYEPVSRTLTPGEARNYWGNYSQVANDRFVYDASFIKLRQVTLGYTFTKRLLSKLPFRTLTISVVGRNLAILFKNVENIDPESSYTSSNAQGLDYFGVPASRTYGFNVNATF